MIILLATDIFGITDAVESLSKRLNVVCESVQILDPYGAKRMNFQDEDQAYEAFNQLCGLEAYATLCAKALEARLDEDLVMIGFSMGASAIWKALDGRTNVNIKSFYGFYSSQIRYFLDAKINVSCTLFFPKYEKHFDVDEVITQLVNHEKITCLKTEYLHGFMNPYSINYDAKGYEEYSRWIEEKLELF